MPYKHGVYASEIATSISPAGPSESALPFVVGTASDGDDFEPKLISSWDEYKDAYGYDGDWAGWDAAGFVSRSLESFAYYWFNIMGRGRAILVKVPDDEETSDVSDDDLITAINLIDSVYSRFAVVPTLLLCPYYNTRATVRAVMISRAESFGGKWDCLALVDIPSTTITGIAAITDSSNIAAWKKTNIGSNSHVAAFWPSVGVGDKRFDLSTVCAAVMARTDAQNGDYPYVSPSNKQAGIDGAYVFTGYDSETPIYMTEQKVNDDLNANGVVGVVNSAAGWVIWGNNTTIYPTSTDVKDSQIPIRRMFSFVKNMFLQFCAGRVDLPLNKRQLDGIINSFNQQLQGLKGMGAVNSASVRLADNNTALSLLDGFVYIHILISPPPPMRVIEGVVEYDVTGFVESLA